MYLEYEIYKKRPSLTEVLGELLPIYDLELYKELGDQAFFSDNLSEALNWYTKGRAMALELRDEQRKELFKDNILKCL